MTHFAYVSIGATGHVFPSLALTRELVSRGHTVTYIIPSWAAPLVAHTGARIASYESPTLATPLMRVNGFESGDVPIHIARELETALPQLITVLDRVRPDVALVYGYTHAGALAAEKIGVPLLRMEVSYLTGDVFSYFCETEAGRIKGRLTTSHSLLEFERIANPVCDRFAIPRRSFHELMSWRGIRNIVFVDRAFHPAAENYDQDTHFVGPMLDGDVRPKGETNDLTFWPPKQRGDEHLRVLIAFGSIFTFQPAILEMVAEALAGQSVDVLFLAGHTLPKELLSGLPDNIRAVRSAPQLEVIQHADLFINHGGMGSVMESLYFGVPVLAIPPYPEQLVTALRCEELGVGRHLDRESISIALLRKTVMEMLSNESYQDRAKSFATRMQSDGGCERACDLVLGP